MASIIPNTLLEGFAAPGLTDLSDLTDLTPDLFPQVIAEVNRQTAPSEKTNFLTARLTGANLSKDITDNRTAGPDVSRTGRPLGQPNACAARRIPRKVASRRGSRADLPGIERYRISARPAPSRIDRFAERET